MVPALRLKELLSQKFDQHDTDRACEELARYLFLNTSGWWDKFRVQQLCIATEMHPPLLPDEERQIQQFFGLQSVADIYHVATTL
jgi:hypothetical protein